MAMHAHSVVSQLSDHVVCNLTSELNEILMPIWSDYFALRNSLSSEVLFTEQRRSDIDLGVLDNTVFTQTGLGGASIQEGGNGGRVGTAGGHV